MGKVMRIFLKEDLVINLPNQSLLSYTLEFRIEHCNELIYRFD